ncbi:hypothetical protein AK812_SmicGene27979 [Symbiodinium microadriaticum]|uniref:Uncharacterized protein n=1 Tax=Symbiodinium microadriaticum TaxID=2951 RepID=A0A1Q9D5J8_SYMMI|nr:hypothetical protein AK812_SmicGene27979 [Symbiodinium microadriaticum]
MPVPDYPAFWTQATDLATLEPHDFGNLSVSPEASRPQVLMSPCMASASQRTQKSPACRQFVQSGLGQS